MHKTIVVVVVALALACGGGPTEPEEPIFYTGEYIGYKVNDFLLEDIGLDFDMSMREDLTCELRQQWEGQEQATAGCTYTKPDIARDATITLDPPYEDESYPLHWDATGDTLRLSTTGTMWILVRGGE